MIVRTSWAIALVASVALRPQVVFARQDISPPETQQLVAVLQELRAIRLLLERLLPPAPKPVANVPRVTLDGISGYSLGRPDAPLTIVEFSDMQCPFCREFAKTTFVQLKAKWIDTGTLQWVSRDFPLEFHSEALRAAKASRCSGDQGKFWDMRLALVRNATSLSSSFVEQQARALALNMKEFSHCLETGEHDDDIEVDIASGRKIGVSGTPTFVIGRTPRTGPFNGILVAGALPYSALEGHLTALLTSDK